MRRLATAALLALATVTAAAPHRPCSEHPKIVGKCFSFRGRLANYLGAPTRRIWRIGTTRILGVSDSLALPEFEQVPANVRDALGDSFERYIFADFEFCAFTADKPGVMRLGCGNLARNLKIVEQH